MEIKQYIGEIWRPIKGYEGLYEVSNLGRVKSLILNNTGREKILISSPDSYGYLVLSLYKKNKKRRQFKAHRLVAEAFIPNPLNLPCVNHKNEDKTDNRVENLEWCDWGYNARYGTRNVRISKTKIEKSLGKIVLQYTLEGEFVKEYSSIGDASRQTGICSASISRCVYQRHYFKRGREYIAKTAGGYKWQLSAR